MTDDRSPFELRAELPAWAVHFDPSKRSALLYVFNPVHGTGRALRVSSEAVLCEAKGNTVTVAIPLNGYAARRFRNSCHRSGCRCFAVLAGVYGSSNEIAQRYALKAEWEEKKANFLRGGGPKLRGSPTVDWRGARRKKWAIRFKPISRQRGGL